MGTFFSRFLRFAPFGAIPVVSAATSLIALPAISSRFGADGWAAIAIGMSIGTGASVLGELGWSLDGPPRASGRRHETARRQLYAFSIITKLAILPITISVAVILATILSPNYTFASALMAAATACLGLSMSWYFVGTGEPLRIIATDSAPKFFAALTATVLIWNGADISTYPIAFGLAAVASPLIDIRLVRVPFKSIHSLSFRRILHLIGAQRTALTGRAFSALYIALPTALVSLVAPQAVPVFAAAERLQRMYLALLQALPNALLNWAARPSDPWQRLQRSEKTILINVGLGLIAGILWLVVSDRLADIVFAGEVTIPFEVVLLSAIVIWLTCCSRAVGGIGLVTLKNTKAVSDSARLGAASGIVAITGLASIAGAFGGMAGEVVAESSVLAVQLRAWFRTRRALFRR